MSDTAGFQRNVSQLKAYYAIPGYVLVHRCSSYYPQGCYQIEFETDSPWSLSAFPHCRESIGGVSLRGKLA